VYLLLHSVAVISFSLILCALIIFYSNVMSITRIYPLSLHDALPIWTGPAVRASGAASDGWISVRPPIATSFIFPMFVFRWMFPRSEEHTSELQSLRHLVCRLLLEKKNEIFTGTL